MSLRIRRYDTAPQAGDDVPTLRPAATATAEQDNWDSRIIKLIPAEALALYGTGTAIVGRLGEGQKYDPLGLGILIIACLILIIAVRMKLTKSKAGEKPQYFGILISIISFALWLMALGGDAGFSSIWGEGRQYMGALLAIIWGTLLPYFYKGN